MEDVNNIPYLKNPTHCYYCNIELTYYRGDPLVSHKRKNSEYTVDHIIPRSKGGTDHIYNRLNCCNRCNGLKDNKGLRTFRKYIISNRDKFAYTSVERLIRKVDTLIKHRKENTNKMFDIKIVYANNSRNRIKKRNNIKQGNSRTNI